MKKKLEGKIKNLNEVYRNELAKNEKKIEKVEQKIQLLIHNFFSFYTFSFLTPVAINEKSQLPHELTTRTHG